jgi:hypothetical protein
MAVLQLRRMLTGNVPGNEASYGDTCVFGGSPGTDVQASKLDIVNGLSMAMNASNLRTIFYEI